MSKTLSYTQLTVHAGQTLRRRLADVARHRDAGHDDLECCSWAAAVAVHAMWESLVLEHLDPHRRRSFMDDFARLEALMHPDDAAPAAIPI